jgi:hypothetical protein
MTSGVRHAVFALTTGLLLAGPFAGALFAQRNQPIYPAYDGYIKNDDGSYTVAYAYFSHNADVVTIAPGPDNQFSPGPADRQHPTTFHPGHNRFQCIMVVGPDFDGKLLWSVTYGGVTTSTSQHMLQSNWYLVEGAAQLKAIDFAKVPRGVCLNQPPSVRILGLGRGGRGAPPTLSAVVGEALNLFGSVHDEGLPRSGKLVAGWKALDGPGPVAFENAASARTRARFTVPGTYTLELTASDSEHTRNTRVSVTVAASK